ncbi:MAG TPA: hypothetical protein VFZ59_01160 [Verrucomicrobiae bacterium]|nr:hypothetical protein [Verrucomicrobiae bacterium]
MRKPRIRSSVSLFFDDGTRLAVLVVERAGRMKRRTLRFADAHKALSWCIAHRAKFIYLPSPDHSGN